MLDYSQASRSVPEEWLTVAARDNDARGIGADDQGDAMTIFNRIKGGDLQAMHAGRITSRRSPRAGRGSRVLI